VNTFAVTAAEVSEMKNPPTVEPTRPHCTADFESEVNQFRGFLHRLLFPYFPTRFLIDFFTYNTQISTENIYRILIKQTGQRPTHF
jgi:hypothetical protein